MSSSVPKYKWLGITLIGWCAMQFAEGILWLTEPRKGCTETNKFITKYIIKQVNFMSFTSFLNLYLGTIGGMYTIFNKRCTEGTNFELFSAVNY